MLRLALMMKTKMFETFALLCFAWLAIGADGSGCDNWSAPYGNPPPVPTLPYCYSDPPPKLRRLCTDPTQPQAPTPAAACSAPTCARSSS